MTSLFQLLEMSHAFNSCEFGGPCIIASGIQVVWMNPSDTIRCTQDVLPTQRDCYCAACLSRSNLEFLCFGNHCFFCKRTSRETTMSVGDPFLSPGQYFFLNLLNRRLIYPKTRRLGRPGRTGACLLMYAPERKQDIAFYIP